MNQMKVKSVFEVNVADMLIMLEVNQCYSKVQKSTRKSISNNGHGSSR